VQNLDHPVESAACLGVILRESEKIQQLAQFSINQSFCEVETTNVNKISGALLGHEVAINTGK
jgi:hypothetical protein